MFELICLAKIDLCRGVCISEFAETRCNSRVPDAIVNRFEYSIELFILVKTISIDSLAIKNATQ